MSKSASIRAQNSLTGSSGNIAAGWRSPVATELHRTDLLYLGSRVRRVLEPSQASAELEQAQRIINPNASIFAREMSAAYFSDQPNANLSGAVAFVGCKTGQALHRSLPISGLMQLVALERFGREHQDIAAFGLIGFESAKKGLIKSAPSQYELLCRYAFKVQRSIESQSSLFSRITPLLDCEVLNSSDAIGFTRRRRDQDMRDSDRIATAVQALGISTSGVQVKVGATKYPNRRLLENAKRFACRDQMHLFLGQTIAEDEQLIGQMAFLYGAGPASKRLGLLMLNHDDIKAADWLQVDHLTVSEAEFGISWQEHDQIDGLYKAISELDPALSIVDERLAWTLDCSQRLLDFHDRQLFEISTNKLPVSTKVIDNLKRDYSRAMRTYLRDLAARNFDWLLGVSRQLGFQVDAPTRVNLDLPDDQIAGVAGKIGPTAKSASSGDVIASLGKVKSKAA